MPKKAAPPPAPPEPKTFDELPSLVMPADIAKFFPGFNAYRVAQYLRRSKAIQPAHSFKNYGGNISFLYEKQKAREVIEAIAAKEQREASAKEQKIKAKAEGPKSMLASAPAALPDLAPLKIMSDLASCMRDWTKSQAAANDSFEESIMAAVGKVTEQNKVLLKGMDHIRTDVMAALGAIQATLDDIKVSVELILTKDGDDVGGAQGGQNRGEPSGAAKPLRLVAAPDTRKMRIGIVTLYAGQAAVIVKEFGDAFDLRIVDTNDARVGHRLGSMVSGCDLVLALKDFMNRHAVSESLPKEALKASGARLEFLDGGMTALKTKLRHVFAHPEDYRRKAAA